MGAFFRVDYLLNPGLAFGRGFKCQKLQTEESGTLLQIEKAGGSRGEFIGMHRRRDLTEARPVLKFHPFVEGPFHDFRCDNIEYHDKGNDQEDRYGQRLKTQKCCQGSYRE